MRKLLSLLALAVFTAGCSRARETPHAGELPRTLPLEVLADRPADASLPAAHLRTGPAAQLVLVRIAPQRESVAPPPEAAPAEPPAAAAQGEPLPDDDRLHPPLPRSGTQLRLSGERGRWVELDVRVDENGEVTQAEFAGGNADTTLVRAALEAARSTRWYPARRGGRAVAVWSRQRLEVSP